MSPQRIAAFGTWLVSLAAILGAFGGWHLPTPPEAAAILASFGAFLHALYTEKPNG